MISPHHAHNKKVRDVEYSIENTMKYFDHKNIFEKKENCDLYKIKKELEKNERQLRLQQK